MLIIRNRLAPSVRWSALFGAFVLIVHRLHFLSCSQASTADNEGDESDRSKSEVNDEDEEVFSLLSHHSFLLIGLFNKFIYVNNHDFCFYSIKENAIRE